jgi:hypothetical protein
MVSLIRALFVSQLDKELVDLGRTRIREMSTLSDCRLVVFNDTES